MKKHNFSAGPCILPEEVLEKASKAVLNFNNDNLSLIEISHRSTPLVDVMNEAKQLVKDLLAVPDNYSILFLQGGASLEFLMVPFNLLSKNLTSVPISYSFFISGLRAGSPKFWEGVKEPFPNKSVDKDPP